MLKENIVQIDLKFLLWINFLSFIFCLTFIIFNISECQCYWMHDASIKVTYKWIITYISYLFIIPIILLIISKYLKIEIPKKAYLVHFIMAVISIFTLLTSINKPCEFINGGNYMFINFSLILVYYLFKLFTVISLIYIIIKTLKFGKILNQYNRKKASH